ncbi:unnamed protein product, partial [Prorocentrum cordatum]
MASGANGRGSPSSELAALRAELRAERAELRGELAALRGELAALRGELQAKRATRPRGAGDSTARPARLDSGVAPKDPVEFIATLRRAHAGRRADPQGQSWPWTDDDVINRQYSLDERRAEHAVTQELLQAAQGMDTKDKVAHSIAVRYRQSARGAAARFAAAIQGGSLERDVLAPLTRECKGDLPPYRNVVPKAQLAEQLWPAAAAIAGRVPFDTVLQARGFIKQHLVADVSLDGTRVSPFSAGEARCPVHRFDRPLEVAKDLVHFGLVLDGSTAPMETGARKGLAAAKKLFPDEPWSLSSLAERVGCDEFGAEILWCEYGKHVRACANGVTREYVPRYRRQRRSGRPKTGPSEAPAPRPSEACLPPDGRDGDFVEAGGDSPGKECQLSQAGVPAPRAPQELVSVLGAGIVAELLNRLRAQGQLQGPDQAGPADERPAVAGPSGGAEQVMKRRRVVPTLLSAAAPPKCLPAAQPTPLAAAPAPGVVAARQAARPGEAAEGAGRRLSQRPRLAEPPAGLDDARAAAAQGRAAAAQGRSQGGVSVQVLRVLAKGQGIPHYGCK